jgi:hypothetical protein
MQTETAIIPFVNKVEGISPSMNRQVWVEKAVAALRDHFASRGYTVPDNLRVTIGFPKGGRTRIGECHFTEASVDKHFEIFISPELGQGSKYKEQPVIEVIAHEICHTIAGYEAGHKAPFKRVATAIGLTGKMTSTKPGPDMLAFIEAFEKKHGPYPAGALSRSMVKKKATYLIKCECPHCGYTVRTTAKWLENGDPICPVDNEGMVPG